MTVALSQPAGKGRIEAVSGAWPDFRGWNFCRFRRLMQQAGPADRGGHMRIWAGGAVAVASLWLAVSSGLAQQNPAMENPSVVQPKSMAPTTAPLSVGANSFSEGQARDLLVSRGFSDVSQLMNDSQGIWRGTAKNGTQRVRVSVDFKGNVSAQPE
ncbi:hypothetical protein [Tardiphaga alba]|nr:hypothetical protein [Tardiphaga alba]